MASLDRSTAIAPALALRRLLFGQRVTRILSVAAHLGIADQLADGPKETEELALRVGPMRRPCTASCVPWSAWGCSPSLPSGALP